MLKKKNNGFSMVEILIAITIFSILMIPVVAGIIQSLKSSTKAKELQYRNEFAENLMEHVKTVPLSEMTASDYYYENGTTAGSFSVGSTAENTYDVDTNADGVNDKVVKSEKYDFSGEVVLGTEKTPYYYKVEVDNDEYVQKGANDITFIDPNNLALGIVEDIDYRQVALIDGTILNYDFTAATAFKTRKLQGLKEKSETSYKQEMEGGDSLFLNDNANRLITIEVSGNSSSGYEVRCILDYIDTSIYLNDETKHLQYVPYAKTFKDKLPNIYLTYNPFFYNGGYAQDDYVVLDVSGLTDTVKPDVKLFMIEIASSYSKNLIDSGTIEESKQSAVLYNNKADNGTPRSSVRIHAGVLKASTVSGDALKDNSNIYLYHNIGDNSEKDGSDKINKKSDASKFWYKATAALTDADTGAGISETSLLGSFDALSTKNFVAFVSYKNDSGSSDKNATVGFLNSATETNRALYNIKVWLKKKSDGAISDSDKPILQGTKGGSRLD